MTKTVEQFTAEATVLADDFITKANAVVDEWTPKFEAFAEELTKASISDSIKAAILIDMSKRVDRETVSQMTNATHKC